MTHVNGNSVSAVVEVSRKVYARSLVLYPHELRREFGAEMVDPGGAQNTKVMEATYLRK